MESPLLLIFKFSERELMINRVFKCLTPVRAATIVEHKYEITMTCQKLMPKITITRYIPMTRHSLYARTAIHFDNYRILLVGIEITRFMETVIQCLAIYSCNRIIFGLSMRTEVGEIGMGFVQGITNYVSGERPID